MTSVPSVVNNDDAVFGMMADTTIAEGTPPPVTSRVDSAPSKDAGGYFRPVPAALRGLVPEWNGGKLWGGGFSATPMAMLPALRPRPPECPNGMANFGCGRAIMKWRDDSIYHVSVLCHRDPRRTGQRLSSDCSLYRRDSLPD